MSDVKGTRPHRPGPLHACAAGPRTYGVQTWNSLTRYPVELL
jgi:hypothetical protein